MRVEQQFLLGNSGSQTTDIQWRHKSKKPEILSWCGKQNMLQPYLKIWDWDLIVGQVVRAISSLGVHSPWPSTYLFDCELVSQSYKPLFFFSAISQFSLFLNFRYFTISVISQFLLFSWSFFLIFELTFHFQLEFHVKLNFHIHFLIGILLPISKENFYFHFVIGIILPIGKGTSISIF